MASRPLHVHSSPQSGHSPARLARPLSARSGPSCQCLWELEASAVRSCRASKRSLRGLTWGSHQRRTLADSRRGSDRLFMDTDQSMGSHIPLHTTALSAISLCRMSGSRLLDPPQAETAPGSFPPPAQTHYRSFLAPEFPLWAPDFCMRARYEKSAPAEATRHLP
jgi:hypothetical protein